MLKSSGMWWYEQFARYRYRQGMIYARKGQYHLAISRFNRALLHHPQPEEVCIARGLIYFRLGDLDAALADFDRAIALNPSNSKAYGNRGLVKAQLGEEAAALEDWRVALTHRPCYAEARYNRGLVFVNQKNFQYALDEFDLAIQANPNLAEAYLHRGNVRDHLGDRFGAARDWQLALLNDLSLDAAKKKLFRMRRESHEKRLTEKLGAVVKPLDLNLQVERQGRQLNLLIQREPGTPVNYQDVAKLLQAKIVDLNLNWLERFRIIGRMGTGGLPDWDKVYPIYDNCDCPPIYTSRIIASLLFFMPFGIAAIVYATQVKANYAQGNYRAALTASKLIKWFYWISLSVFSATASIVVFGVILLLLRGESLSSIMESIRTMPTPRPYLGRPYADPHPDPSPQPSLPESTDSSGD
ncbi:MAG: tetratricopeptide repeat protein [Cyanobacteria bacterium J06638_20]